MPRKVEEERYFSKEVRKITDQCIGILSRLSVEENNQWLVDNKINSYALRNDRALEVITTANYILPKFLIQKQHCEELFVLKNMISHYKSSKKCFQFCHLLKHFSLWDYEFEFVYRVFCDEDLENVALYLNCRSNIIQSNTNKYKKSILSGVVAQIQEWSKLAQSIFKVYEEREVVEQFVQVVKNHYLTVKKNQNEDLNGAEFFKICQIIAINLPLTQPKQRPEERVGARSKSLSKTGNKASQKALKPMLSVGEVFKESILTNLSSEDRELIRVLSAKDKNVARMLEEKHNQMVTMIGQEVDNLRRDIEVEKTKYLDVVQEKKALLLTIEKIKKRALDYIVDPVAKQEEELLQILQDYNQKYNPHSLDVEKVRKKVEHKRLLEVIENEERMP